MILYTCLASLWSSLSHDLPLWQLWQMMHSLNSQSTAYQIVLISSPRQCFLPVLNFLLKMTDLNFTNWSMFVSAFVFSISSCLQKMLLQWNPLNVLKKCLYRQVCRQNEVLNLHACSFEYVQKLKVNVHTPAYYFQLNLINIHFIH